MRKKTYKKGFTIIESLVAIVVMVMATIGAMSAVQFGLSSYIFSKDQVSAFYLAQEGFEQIRNMRDVNRLNGRHWLTGLALNSSDPCFFGQACIVSPVETLLAERCSTPSTCPRVRYQPSSGFFGYNPSWTASNFTRSIEFASVNANEVSVTVTVTWSKGLINRQFKARENLFNW